MMSSSNLPQKIVLTGFRATGKSTLGLLIAKRLGYLFVDTDQALQQQLGSTIAQIVASHGWPFFRRAEAQLLRELSTSSSLVIATGGGAIEHQAEWQLLRQKSFVVWLDADAVTINQRIAADNASSAQRPALLSGASPKDEIAQLLYQRTPLYERGSDLRLDTVNACVQDLASALCKALQRGASDETNERGRCCAPGR